jgi:hypothetical protein
MYIINTFITSNPRLIYVKLKKFYFVSFFSSHFSGFVNFIINLTVYFSPCIVFLCYYMNACVAHNIYVTYKDYKKSYSKRILLYKYSAAVICSFVFLVSLFTLEKTIPSTSNKKNITFLFIILNSC